MTFHILHLKGHNIFDQLKLEEALLRADGRNFCIINEGSAPAIVMGISGKAEEMVNLQKQKANPIPIIRRFSGGGTVVVDENTLFVSFICERSLHPFPAYPEKILSWSEGFYIRALEVEGFRLRENDYIIDDKKVGGNAQYIRKERWLHHTTFLWDYQDELMEYLPLPKKRPIYRLERHHSDFLTRLNGHFNDKQEMVGRIKEKLKEEFETIDVDYNTLKPLLDLPSYRKTTALVS